VSTPLLQTKLYIPHSQPNLISRPRLIKYLEDGLSRKLTLVSAPAGFGKTTLLSEWIHKCGRPAAWISLDQGDNDPSRFLKYFITALQKNEAEIGEGILSALQSSPPPKTDIFLTGLLNEIAEMIQPFVIVLDDYSPAELTHLGRWPVCEFAVNWRKSALVICVSQQMKLRPS
jgi:LuxR family maltose regulon positive regulatory protein